MQIKVLKSFNGDSFLLNFIDKDNVYRNILIDGGIGSTYFKKNKGGKIAYNDLFDVIESIRKNKQKIDLLILTHVDDDHIGGILKWLKTDKAALDLIDQVWFNSGKIIKDFLNDPQFKDDYSLNFSSDQALNTSIKQGAKFEEFLELKEGLWDKQVKISGQTFPFFDLTIRIISPDKEKLSLLLKKWTEEAGDSLNTAVGTNDYNDSLQEHIAKDVDFKEDDAVHNGSSIGIIISYQSKNILFLGDAHPSVIINSLTHLDYSPRVPLKCELVKISHHGSKSNNSIEMLKMIDSSKYIISTNGDKHAHPHKRFIARLVNHRNDCQFYFNYPEVITKLVDDTDRADFKKVTFLPITEDFII